MLLAKHPITYVVSCYSCLLVGCIKGANKPLTGFNSERWWWNLTAKVANSVMETGIFDKCLPSFLFADLKQPTDRITASQSMECWNRSANTPTKLFSNKMDRDEANLIFDACLESNFVALYPLVCMDSYYSNICIGGLNDNPLFSGRSVPCMKDHPCVGFFMV